MPTPLFSQRTATARRGCLFCTLIAFCTLALLSSLSFATQAAIDYQYRVIKTFPHSRDVFTQGLEFHNNLLYEGTGLHGQSRVLIRTLQSTTPIRRRFLDTTLFGEGITILHNRLYQLTWQSGRAFMYKADTLQPEGEFTLSGEGWGLTNNGKQLIVSNGSQQLTFIDPAGKNVVKTLDVTLNGKALYHLNELEWVDGAIYANIWKSPWIVMIDPNNGKVTGRVNLQRLLPDRLRDASTDVLNGIAYDRKNKRLFVTGKNWPRLYQIELYKRPHNGKRLTTSYIRN